MPGGACRWRRCRAAPRSASGSTGPAPSATAAEQGPGPGHGERDGAVTGWDRDRERFPEGLGGSWGNRDRAVWLGGGRVPPCLCGDSRYRSPVPVLIPGPVLRARLRTGIALGSDPAEPGTELLGGRLGAAVPEPCVGVVTGEGAGTGPVPHVPAAPFSSPPPQTDEAVRALLQRFYALQGERVEAYRLLEE